MKRVRYIKTENPDIIVSAKVFPVDNRSYRVRLNLADNTFSIGNLTTDTEAIRGSAVSPHKLKIKVKKELERLGVIFTDEKREKPIPKEIVDAVSEQVDELLGDSNA